MTSPTSSSSSSSTSPSVTTPTTSTYSRSTFSRFTSFSVPSKKGITESKIKTECDKRKEEIGAIHARALQEMKAENAKLAALMKAGLPKS